MKPDSATMNSADERVQPSGYTLAEEAEAERLAIKSGLGISEWLGFLSRARTNLQRDSSPQPATHAERIAETIVDDLFGNSERLILSDHGEDKGRSGWSRLVVKERIRDAIISDAQPTATVSAGEDKATPRPW